MGEMASAPRNSGETGLWSFRPFMDFARVPRKVVETGVETGSGVLKPKYSFTFAKGENKLVLYRNVCKGRKTRFRSLPVLCTLSTTPY